MHAAVAPSRARTAGGRAALVLLVPLALPVAVACAAAPPDGDVVYCLSAAHRAQFVESAATLADASGDEPVRLDPADLGAVRRWRATHPEPFERACAAIAPRPSGGSDPQSWLLGLVNLVVGAVLATVTSLTTLRVTQRRQVSGALSDELARLASLVGDVSAAGSETSVPPPAMRVERVEAVRRTARQARSLARTGVGAGLEDDLNALAAVLAGSVADMGRRGLDGHWRTVRAAGDALTDRLTDSPPRRAARALRRLRPGGGS